MDAEERIFANELGITILDRFKCNHDYFFSSKKFDNFEYVFFISTNRLVGNFWIFPC